MKKYFLILVLLGGFSAAFSASADEFGKRFSDKEPLALGKGDIVTTAPQDIEPASGEEVQADSAGPSKEKADQNVKKSPAAASRAVTMPAQK